ncbi:hypothetical protein ACJMK2_009623 [Sinanodonta woodiana]|uniref:Uncharacterized protein n=1 Tax=Sinanodonta woodiana TaxID=1069815 RepID=A0ABD3VCS3_SINWO
MMKRLGTKRLWSLYSFKGRKGNKSFQDIFLCNDVFVLKLILKYCVAGACLKKKAKSKEREIEEAISETHKYAPNQRGGIKCKVSEQIKGISSGAEEETNSDSKY